MSSRAGPPARAVLATAASPDDPLGGLSVGPVPPLVTAAGDRVVRIRAAALNHHDLWTLRGLVPVRFPRVLGSDGAGDGVIVHPGLSCGDVESCHGCRTGSPHLCRRLTMLGEGRDGTMAPEVAAPADHVMAAPHNLTPVEAACLPSAYLTAFRMLFRVAGLGPGDSVLVTGASGGVGVAVVQLGAAAGLRVVAQVRDLGAAPALEGLGAALVVHVDDDVKARAGGEVDAVVESVGRATWAGSLRAVRPGGTILVTGATSGDPPADLRRIFWRQLRVLGVSLGSVDDLAALVEFVEMHDLHPRVAGVYPLEDAVDAFRALLAGRVLGKIVLTI